MRKYALFLGVLLTGVCSTHAAPLIFKAEATIDQGEKNIVLGTFDASKFRQVRIAIIAIRNGDPKAISREDAKFRLEVAQSNLRRNESLYQKGLISKSEYDRYEEEVRKAQEDVNRAEKIADPSAGVYGVEGNDLILLAGTSNKLGFNFTNVIDSPPSRVTVTVGGRATYRLYVWGL